MPKRFSNRDENQSAFDLVQRVIARTEDSGQTPQPRVVSIGVKRKNPAAVALGRMGGRKSAEARMAKIDPADRSRIASAAARARWAKKKSDR